VTRTKTSLAMELEFFGPARQSMPVVERLRLGREVHLGRDRKFKFERAVGCASRNPDQDVS
jgi:hypothetical protein